MKIAVYCGASSGRADGPYQAEARKLGELMAQHNIDLVYGGSSVGLMGSVADGVLDAGGHVCGVMPQVLVEREQVHSFLEFPLDTFLLEFHSYQRYFHLFETKYIQLLFNKIEDAHNDIFYNVFLKNVSSEDILKSGASEYELYFNFMLKYYNNEIIIRELQWKNTNSLDNKDNNNYHYISYHWYMRT